MSSVRALLVFVLAASAAGCGGAPDASLQNTSSAAPVASAPQSTTAASTQLPAGLPPIPVVPFPLARPMEIVRPVLAFAAEHPEVLGKMPCFCGCENRGHKHNDDCFVAKRDAGGRVTEWEEHGLG